MSSTPTRYGDAIRLGTSRRTLEQGSNPFHGVWTPVPPATLTDRCRALLTGAGDEVWFSHATAAVLYGIWLPERLADLTVVDATMPAPRRALRGSGIRGRQRTPPAGSVQLWNGLPLTTPAQTFVDLADLLHDDDLVAAGDSLLCWKGPLATRAEIDAAVAEHKGRRGHRRLLRAVAFLVDRSRSRPESLYRKTFLDEGIPMPKLNVRFRVNPGRTAAPDMAWWEARVALEYEGDQHRTDRQQWQQDLGRYSDLADAGWEVRRVSGTTRAVRLEAAKNIRALLRDRWDSSRPSPEVVPDS